MPVTIPSIETTDDWIDVYSVTGISVGSPLSVQNTGSNSVLIRISEEKPDKEDDSGNLIYPTRFVSVARDNYPVWIKSAPKSPFSRVQVDIYNGILEGSDLGFITSQSLQIQFGLVTLAPNTQGFLKIENKTTSPITLDQLVNLEAYATNSTSGTSLVTILIYFNPNFTGSTELPADSKAYANDIFGQFIDITEVGVAFANLTGFDTVINSDVIRVGGSKVSYFQSNQSLSIDSVSIDRTFVNQLVLPPNGSIVASFLNTPLLDGGAESIITAYLSGSFLTVSGQVELPPDNIITENDDNMIAENEDNLITERGS